MDRAQQLANLDDCIAIIEQELVDIERGTKDANLDALASYAVPKEYVELCKSCAFPPLPQLTPLPVTELSSTRGGGRRASAGNVTDGSSAAAAVPKSRIPKRGRDSLGDSNIATTTAELPQPAAKMSKSEESAVVTTTNATTEEASPRVGGRRGRAKAPKEDGENEEMVLPTGRRGTRAVEKGELPPKEEVNGDVESADTKISTRKKKEVPEQEREKTKEKEKEEAAEDKGTEQRVVRGRRKSEPKTESPIASSDRAPTRRNSGLAPEPSAPPPPQLAAGPVAQQPARRTRGKDSGPEPEPEAKASSPRGGTRTATKAVAAAKEEEGRRTRGSAR